MADSKELTFDNLRLLPGQVLQLEFDGYDAARDRSTLVGYQKGRNVLVSTPTKQGVPMSVKPKALVKVRLFVNQINAACAFEASVAHVTVIPFPHVHLTWPKQLVLGEVRKSIRANVNIVSSLMIELDGKKQTMSAVIDNLSINGARIQCKQLDAKEGEELDLVFKIVVGEVERILQVSSVIRSAQYSETKDVHMYGLQFLNVSEEDTITLHAFVLTKLHTG